MKSRRGLRRAAGSTIALLAVLSLGACATSHARGGANHEPSTVIHLTNDLTPPSDVSVYAVGQGGIRLLLGDLPPNEHKVMHLPSGIHPGTTYRLVAERTLGRRIISQPISATNEDLMIDWDLGTNSMWFPKDSGS